MLLKLSHILAFGSVLFILPGVMFFLHFGEEGF